MLSGKRVSNEILKPSENVGKILDDLIGRDLEILPENAILAQFELTFGSNKVQMAPRCEDDHLNVRSGGAVRKKLIAAQASAKTYQDVMDQGEVVHWMSALNPDLVQYGKDLVNRGYSTLDSVALLVEEDIDNEIRPQLRKQLIGAISLLRQDLFRM